MKFIDEATIDVEAGHGGSGCKHFRREKYVPYGGPDGGNGGHGGSIILLADEGIQTLLDLRFKPHWKAANGQPGEGSRRDGKAGDDLIIKVPVGTQVLNPETRELIADLDTHNQQAVIARGGRGGLGNASFKSSTNRTPEYFQPGEEGEAGSFLLSLKLVADVGLIGHPNAGKSTLISRISAAQPKIADYPFTTLIPNLGVVKFDDRSFVVADIPGLIPGAHEGRGLGIKFLKHVERTKVLVHLVDITPALLSSETGEEANCAELLKRYQEIRDELALFSEELAAKRELLVLTKSDAVPAEITDACVKFFENNGHEVLTISSVAGKGIGALIEHIVKMLDESQF